MTVSLSGRGAGPILGQNFLAIVQPGALGAFRSSSRPASAAVTTLISSSASASRAIVT